MWFARALAILTGALAGALTGFLHVKFAINKFLAGIIVVAISYSLGLRIMGSSNIGMLRLPSVFDSVTRLDSWGSAFHFGTLILLALLVAMTIVLVLKATASRRGIRLRVAGSNPEYAKDVGDKCSCKLDHWTGTHQRPSRDFRRPAGFETGLHRYRDGTRRLDPCTSLDDDWRESPAGKFMSYHAFVVVAAILGSILYQLLVSYAVTAELNPIDLKLATSLLVLVVVVVSFTKNGDAFADALR